jgi:hypothetical protein
MEIRSVGEITQFLGDLMAYQEAVRAYKGGQAASDGVKLNSVLTFGYCATDVSPDPHCGDFFFNVSATNDTEESRFSVRYRGQTYSVPRFSRPDQWQAAGSTPCSKADSRPGVDPSCIDHTLEVLAVVNQLTDLQRSAQDVQQTTPYVSVLP